MGLTIHPPVAAPHCALLDGAALDWFTSGMP
jgi:hypothetical protein